MEKIQEGFDVFVHDANKAFGAVCQVHHYEVYIENGGGFEVALGAAKDVHDEKVVLDSARLDIRPTEAIRRAHTTEDARIS